MRSSPTTALVALVVGAILVIDPSGLAPFGPVKWAIVSTMALACGALLRGDVRVARPPMVAWCAVLAVVAVTAAVGLDPLYAWIGSPERRFGALAWALSALTFLAGQNADRSRVITAATAVAGVVGVWAIAESFGWEPIALVGAGSRPVGTLGSSAYLGAAAALLTPVAVGAAMRERRRWSYACVAVSGIALVVSGARAAWVGAIVATAVVLLVRRHRRALVIAAAALIVAVAVGAVAGVAGRVPDAITSSDGGIRGRLDEWRVAARVVADHPLTGVGPEGYRIAFGGAVDDAYEREHGRDPLPDRAHSAPLDIAATLGIPGLLAYLALVGTVGGFLLRGLRSSPEIAGVAAGVLAYWVQSLFLFPIAELEPVAWALAGTVVVATVRDGETWTIRWPLVARAVIGAAAAGALVAGGLDAVADRRARTILSGHGSDPVAAAALRPDAARYRLAAARAHEDVGDLAAAVADLDHALDVTPRDPVVRGERARLLLAIARATDDGADRQLARTALEDLADDDPRNAAVLLRLGVVRALDGDLDGAETAWLDAERLAPHSAAASTDLAVAYAQQGRRDDAIAAAHRALARDPSASRAQTVLDDLDGT